MKKILYIARNELYALFYSPIAWFLMIVFLIMGGAHYIYVLDQYQGMYFRGGFLLSLVKDLTSTLSATSRSAYLFNIIKDLYMFLPLITMGLLSREMGSGTIKLLYSSPVRIRQIVLGKYLAMLCFMGCIVLLCAVIAIAHSMSISEPDIILIISSLFGLFIVLAIYSAIGLFISSLTAYQIVAAIITLAVFGLISRIGSLWQDVDIVQDITFYLNLPMKATNIVSGLFNLRDLMYFIILTGCFLMFTVFKLKSVTESISKTRKAIRYGLVLVVASIIAYITEQPSINAYADMTRNDVLTISSPTQEVLAKLDDGPLEITVFANLLSPHFSLFQPSDKNFIKTLHLEKYIRFKPDTRVSFVYYYNADTASYAFKTNPGMNLQQIAEKQAKTWRMDLKRFLKPAEAQKLVDIKKEEDRNFFLLKYKDKHAVVRTFNDPEFWPDEDQFSAAINRLIAKPPKILFLNDEIERGPFSDRTRDYKSFASEVGDRSSLLNKGFDFDTLSLLNNNIPDNIAAIVMADPRTPVSAAGLEKINNYIDRGGNLFITAEPDRKEIIAPVFDKLGISFRPGMLIQPGKKLASDAVYAELTDTAKNFSPQSRRLLKNAQKYYGDSVFRILMPGASALEYQEKDGFRIEPLAYTNKKLSWNRIAPISNDSLQLEVAKTVGDEVGEFATVVRMSRWVNNGEQRIVVCGDADFLTKALPFGGPFMRYNSVFGSWCFSYFTYGKFPANTLRPEGKDDKFTITSDDIPTQKLILYWIIPAIIGVIGSVLLIRRKRK